MEANRAAESEISRELISFFEPKSIVVVGGSSDPTKNSGKPVTYLRRYGFDGDVSVVNPTHKEVCGFPSYESVAAVPGSPELAMIMLPSNLVLEAIDECGKLGTRAAIVFGNGFADVGDFELQERLRLSAKRSGIDLLGPNCLGALNTANGVTATFSSFLLRKMFRAGPVGLATQSGSMGNAILLNFQGLGVGISKWVATGNEADLDLLDFVEYLVEDPNCEIIVVYAEAVRAAWRWSGIAHRARKLGKPIIVLKAGISPRSRLAVVSHSGKLTGGHRLWEDVALVEGITTVSSLEELCDAALAFSVTPKQRRAFAVLGTGGAGVLSVDECFRQELPVAELQTSTQERLRMTLPSGATVENPIDPTPTSPLAWKAACEIVVEDPAVGYFMIVVSSLVRPYSTSCELLSSVCEYARNQDIAIGVTFLAASDPFSSEETEMMLERGVLVLPTSDRIIRAFAHVFKYARQNADSDIHATSNDENELTSRNPTKTLGMIDLGHELTRYGVSVAGAAIVRTIEEAIQIFQSFEGSLVVKVEDPNMPHKTEHGLVRVGMSDASEFAATIEEFLVYVSNHGGNVIVQRRVGPGVELLVSCIRDEELGPVVTVGSGGVLTELLQDTFSGLAPIDPDQALEMLKRTRVYQLLKGYRGSTRSDLSAVCDLISKISSYFVEQGQLTELELNPVIVLGEGLGAFVVDLLAVVSSEVSIEEFKSVSESSGSDGPK